MGTKMTFRHIVVQPRTYHDILRELANSPLKASAVRRIHFSPGKGHGTVELNLQEAILVHVTKLQDVFIDSQLFRTRAPATVPFQDCSASQHVTRLTLNRTLFDTPLHLLAFINAFPSLRHLTLRDVFRRAGNSPSQEDLDKLVPPFKRPKLTALDLNMGNYMIASHLFCEESVRRLEVLGLKPWGTQSSWLSLFDRDAAYNNLRHITVHSFMYHRRDATPILPKAPNLKSLTLKDIFIHSRNARLLGHGKYIQHFLLTISANGVEELFFHFKKVSFNHFAEFAIAEWLPCLFDDKFAKLSRVVYTFSGVALTNGRAEIEAHVLDAHKVWDRRGIVEVIVKNDEQ
ncbi:hypothetical protein BC835DRAFT_1384088 [Cytidiella melzeri]|nr:hypothetical protein BC835DRAFT_1384088 [Cytidiella melzeri]